MKFIHYILFLFYFVHGYSQNSFPDTNNYRIQWIDQFPNNQSNNTDKTKRVLDFIFGKKNKAELIKPNAVLKTDSDSYFILDQGNNILFKITNNEKKIPKSLKKNKLDFISLIDLCAFSNNNILFSDSRLNKIFIYNPKKKQIDVLNKKIQLNRPTGIAYSAKTGEIWIVETGAHRISILNKEGKLIKTIGERGVAPGKFNFPTSIWIDNTGKVYIVDTMNFRIQIFDKSGNLLSYFGEHGNATGYFARSKGIATDSHGFIYITDALFHTVQIFDSSGRYLYQFGKQGREKGEFWMPSGIFIDSDDVIYVADSYNSRVQMFKLVKDK